MHHMAKDTSPFSSISEANKKKIFVVNYYALIVVIYRNIEFYNGVITNVYHVPSLTINFFVFISTYYTGKKVEVLKYRFVVKDVTKN